MVEYLKPTTVGSRPFSFTVPVGEFAFKVWSEPTQFDRRILCEIYRGNVVADLGPMPMLIAGEVDTLLACGVMIDRVREMIPDLVRKHFNTARAA